LFSGRLIRLRRLSLIFAEMGVEQLGLDFFIKKRDNSLWDKTVNLWSPDQYTWQVNEKRR